MGVRVLVRTEGEVIGVERSKSKDMGPQALTRAWLNPRRCNPLPLILRPPPPPSVILKYPVIYYDPPHWGVFDIRGLGRGLY